MSLTTIILEDHPMFAAGLKDLAEHLLPGGKVVCTNNLQATLSLMDEFNPLLIIADLNVSDAKGISILESISDKSGDAIVVGFTGDENFLNAYNSQLTQEFLILSKVEPFECVVSTLSRTLRQSEFLNSEVSPQLDFQQLNKFAEGELTPKQKEVLKLMGLGLSNKEIARKMAVSPETIKTHAKDLFGRLGVKNRTQAASVFKRFSYS